MNIVQITILGLIGFSLVYLIVSLIRNRESKIRERKLPEKWARFEGFQSVEVLKYKDVAYVMKVTTDYGYRYVDYYSKLGLNVFLTDNIEDAIMYSVDEVSKDQVLGYADEVVQIIRSRYGKEDEKNFKSIGIVYPVNN